MPEIIDKSKWFKFPHGRCSCTILKILGWKVKFEGLPGTHGILIVYPHTSNIDFMLGILTKWAIGVPFYFLAKDSLFKIPFLGWWLKYVGGRPVIRDSPQGYISRLAREMYHAHQFWLVIAPEGTRKRTPGWRSGFYRLALSTGYPVGLGLIDYSKKEIGVTEFIYMTGDEGIDLGMIRQAYQGVVGCLPQNMAPVKFWSPSKQKKGV
jgi:1-acyl-sn-glycerol-3-phosphate acyltransferase